MTFVEAFYSFVLDISDSTRGIYTRKRLKIAKHPYEPLTHLYARVVAFLHSFEDQLTLSPGLFDQRLPAMYSRDVTGETKLWAEVGELEKKKLEKALKAHTGATFRAYFHSDEQIEAFSHELRGSKTNWIAPVEFLSIDPAFLEELASNESSSAKWAATIVEDEIFLDCDGVDRRTRLSNVDLWVRYQRTIGNV